jgi:hypothetical protein
LIPEIICVRRELITVNREQENIFGSNTEFFQKSNRSSIAEDSNSSLKSNSKHGI